MNGSTLFTNALSTLQTAQAGMALVSQNVNGQSVDGYSRRTLSASVTTLGNGVSIGGFTRDWNQLLQQQQVQQAGVSNLHQAVVDGLSALDTQVADTATALDAPVNKFFTALSTLAQNPSDATLMDSVIASGQAILSATSQFATGLSSVRDQAVTGAQTSITAANQAAAELASINQLIVGSQGAGTAGAAPEVLDRRDVLLKQLGGLVGGNAGLAGDGQAYVFVGGQPLVNGTTAAKLALTGDPTSASGAIGVEMQFQATGATGTVHAAIDSSAVQGTLGGQVLLTQVPAQMNNPADPALAPMAALLGSVQGQGGGGNAAVQALAAIASWQAGQGSRTSVETAIQGLAGVANATGTGSAQAMQDEILGGWRSFTSRLGGLVASHQAAATASKAVETQLQSQWQSQSGVNLDEEAAHLVQYQQQYNAAGSVLKAGNDMLTQLMALLNA